jgi:thiol-disulfide isomerase/thioredoxin
MRLLRLVPALLVLASVRAVAQQPAEPAAAAPAATPAAAAKPAAKPADFYDEHADLKQLVADALARATKENRRVLIQWGGNWCSWCHQLHELYASDAPIKHELLYEYDVVYADIGHFDKNMDVAKGYGAEIKGVPFLTILAADGSVLANQETGSLERGAGQPGHDPAKVLAFLTEHQASYRAAADVEREALAAAGKDGRRVFLHFGAPWCGWCHKLEGWMARPEIAPLLAKDFVDCKIDVERTIGGQELLAKTGGKEGGGIPWFAFLDADGKVLATSDKADGSNTGFPSAPDEIAHFSEMLGKAAVHLSKDDIAKLGASLVPAPAPAAPAAAAAH